MEKFEEEIIKKVNDIWDKELKESLFNIINQKQEEILNGLEKKFSQLDKKLKEINGVNKNNEENKILRKKEINFNNLKKANLVYLSLVENTNPLINVILQCLSNIKYLAEYYLNPEKEEKILKKSKDNPNSTYLGPSFLTLLDHLWKSNQKEYAPIEIHKVLKKLMLNNYNTNDAGIIINFILNRLNEELNFNQEYPNLKQDDPKEHFNRDVSVKKFEEKFMANKTQISDTFFSSMKIKKLCQQCSPKIKELYPQLSNNEKGYQYFFEVSPVVNIYLEENDNFNELSFEKDFHSLLISKEEKNITENCLICGSVQKIDQEKDIYTSSPELIININREKDPNNKINFSYPESFEGKIINIRMPNYQLITVIKKIKNNNNFEYVAFYQNSIDKRWYSFKNQRIESIQYNYKSYIKGDKNTILLIYSKINN